MKEQAVYRQENGHLSCRAAILCEGYDGKKCRVHARGAVHGEKYLLTCQNLNVAGCDDFDCLQVNFSRDGGRTWTGFCPDPAFSPRLREGLRTVACDMTPMYHKKTGKFLVAGHTADYLEGSNRPVSAAYRRRITPYAVFDPETGRFGEQRHIEMPDPEKYRDCGNGCSQCYETESGELLIPVSFREPDAAKAKVTVMRCSFDGEIIRCLELGNDIEVENTARGIGEASIAYQSGRYYLTIRDDACGYLAVSTDGLHFTKPEVLKWTDGEAVPTYNTQAHWGQCGGKLYLVYTRKNGQNDHVFRHRAPLYMAEFDTEKCGLLRETELAVVPERGARLGNFGVTSIDEKRVLIVASEWMQPIGCEAYGSNNAIWLSEVVYRQ